MRRSRALAPLSRDHHQALVIAAALRRASAETAGAASRLFADFLAEHEARHFALEESLLLPVLPAGARGRRLAERVRADHRHLLEAAQRLRDEHLDLTVEQVREIGARLGEHVQMEERELFAYLEQALDPAVLRRIGDRLSGER